MAPSFWVCYECAIKKPNTLEMGFYICCICWSHNNINNNQQINNQQHILIIVLAQTTSKQQKNMNFGDHSKIIILKTKIMIFLTLVSSKLFQSDFSNLPHHLALSSDFTFSKLTKLSLMKSLFQWYLVSTCLVLHLFVFRSSISMVLILSGTYK